MTNWTVILDEILKLHLNIVLIEAIVRYVYIYSKEEKWYCVKLMKPE